MDLLVRPKCRVVKMKEMSKQRRLNCFLKALGMASRMFGLCLQWTEKGIEIQEIDAGDGNPKDLHYSCITQNGGFEYPTVAEDLIYDD
jgi:hypothetical protein